MKIATTLSLMALLALGLACGGYNSKSTPTTPPSAGVLPAISALSPASTAAGSTGVILTVNGSDFNSNAAINWKGAALTTTFVSASQVMATVPDSDVATAGTAAVTVVNPGVAGGIYGGGTSPETSNSMTFTIN
jgi:hypothetical protein